MIFYSGNVQGLAKFYRIPSSATSFSGAGGAPLSVLRSLYKAVRHSHAAQTSKPKEAESPEMFMAERAKRAA